MYISEISDRHGKFKRFVLVLQKHERFPRSVRESQATRLCLCLGSLSYKWQRFYFPPLRLYRLCNECSQWLTHCPSNFERRGLSCSADAHHEKHTARLAGWVNQS
ncbi:hypothetical protein CEXT_40091 [Caerostris extrusa]|uniref:Uncharacterized protein n=1 Tax=Caerostris extrusa TaxID=172846 RepID=A0AAV4MQ99_CAEEX|nr:hypothetical protein CEXT_40091 [Caerostris extrusa]